jgi:hypothetical protein
MQAVTRRPHLGAPPPTSPHGAGVRRATSPVRSHDAVNTPTVASCINCDRPHTTAAGLDCPNAHTKR